jgi:hypothetical protein
LLRRKRAKLDLRTWGHQLLHHRSPMTNSASHFVFSFLSCFPFLIKRESLWDHHALCMCVFQLLKHLADFHET